MTTALLLGCTLTGAVSTTSGGGTDGIADLQGDRVPGEVAATACGEPFTPTYRVQGRGAATPLSGRPVSTEGIVVGDFEGPAPNLRGFYIQDPDGDGDDATSDGLFVFNADEDDVELGQRVRVTGTATEFRDQTQIGDVEAIEVCATGESVAPTALTLPLPSPEWPERLEGMLVELPQTLHVTEHFQLGRFGQVVLSSSDRLRQPTAVAPPGAAARSVRRANDRDRILVDDARNDQNPEPILFGSGGDPLRAANTLRGGDTAAGIVGVLTHTWAGDRASGTAYRVRPVGALGGGVPDFRPANPRPSSPPRVGGSVVVGAFNVLNYFNSFAGCTGGIEGPAEDCRGADDRSEFRRQADKIVAAIVALDADVLGLVELENDGYGPGSAIADLVGRVNAVAGPGRYAFIDADAGTGERNALGIDAIKVGLIYKPDTVTPVGTTAALNTVAFVHGGDGEIRNRPALAQAFEDGDAGRFVAVVNHFKSKGRACDLPDAGDGQGNCNDVRVAAATELVAWLAGDPTDTGDEDVILLGDLNAYALEDPLQVLAAAGYTDLLADSSGDPAYSFVFDGQWGYLDYALASAGASTQVTGVAEWHINADEPLVLDYTEDFKSPAQVASLYAPDAFRSSDHDPVIVGLALDPEPTAGFEGFFAPIANRPRANRVEAGRAIPIRFGLGRDLGLDIFAEGFPRSRPVSCSDGTPVGTGEPLRNPGDSGLEYDGRTGRYSLTWETERGWSGQCRELVVRFFDQREQRALFDFR